MSHIWQLLTAFLVGAASSHAATVWREINRRWRLILFVALGSLAATAFGLERGITYSREWHLHHDPVALNVLTEVAKEGYAYTSMIKAVPGQTIKYVLIIKNRGPGRARIVVGVNNAPLQHYVCDSLRLVNSNTGKLGEKISAPSRTGCLGGGLMTGGVYIDDANPGSIQYIYWLETLDGAITAGHHQLRTYGIARAVSRTNEVYDGVDVNVDA